MTTAGTGVLLQRWNQESLIREFVIIGNTSNN